MTDFAPYDPNVLPAPVLAYLDARDQQRHSDAADAFTPDAVVLDEGGTYRGIDEISRWIASSSTEFTYTSTRLGQRVLDGDRADVQVRLDGDFPGGTVVLRYRFDLRDELIARLVIEI